MLPAQGAAKRLQIRSLGIGFFVRIFGGFLFAGKFYLIRPG